MLSPNRSGAPTSTPGKPLAVPARATASPTVSGMLSDAKRVVGRLLDPNLMAFASPLRSAWLVRLADKVITPTHHQHLDGAVVSMLDTQVELLESRLTYKQRAIYAKKVDSPLEELPATRRTCLRKGRFTCQEPRRTRAEPVSHNIGPKTRSRIAQKAEDEAMQPLKRLRRDNVGRVQVTSCDS